MSLDQTTQKGTGDAVQERIVLIATSELYTFPDHPYGVRDDPAMLNTVSSIQQSGVLVPAIVRPRDGGGYELISGHRRKAACERLGIPTLPCIVRNLSDDEAIIQLVNANAQREDVLPSERAKAYKMRLEATKRQGERTDLTSPNNSAKLRSDDEIGTTEGISGDTIRNMIALNNLIPELMTMVDQGRISLTPAYQLCALTEQEQRLLADTIESEQATPSVSQAQRIRKLSQTGELNEDNMLQIMMEQKKPEVFKLSIPFEKLRKYFPKSYTADRMEETIFKLLEGWQKKRQQTQSR